MPKAKETPDKNSVAETEVSNDAEVIEEKEATGKIPEPKEAPATASPSEEKSKPAAEKPKEDVAKPPEPEEKEETTPEASKKDSGKKSNAQKAEELLQESKEHLVHGRYTEAEKAGEQALVFYEKNRSRAGRADCHETLGIIATMQANYNEAYTQYDKALALYEALKDAENVVDVRQQIKRLDQLRGYA